MQIGSKVRYREDGTLLPMIVVPIFGYKLHITIDRHCGFIRSCATTSAAHSDGRMLHNLVTTDNTGSTVWADSAYRSKTNEIWLKDRMLKSQILRKKTAGKAMPKATARANARKSSIRARIEHVFAHHKNRFGLFIGTIGIARAETKLLAASLAYNFDRLIFHERRWSRDGSALSTGGMLENSAGAAKLGRSLRQTGSRAVQDPFATLTDRLMRMSAFLYGRISLSPLGNRSDKGSTEAASRRHVSYSIPVRRPVTGSVRSPRTDELLHSGFRGRQSLVPMLATVLRLLRRCCRRPRPDG